MNARPVKVDLQDPEDPRRKPRFKSRFCFLMVVGAMKCFNKSMVTVMNRLKQDGFVSQKHLEAFEERVSPPDHWRHTQKTSKVAQRPQEVQHQSGARAGHCPG